MSTAEARRRARANYEKRLRQRGYSWRCVLSVHDDCRGKFGQLMPGNAPRPACACPCHSKPPQEIVEPYEW